MTLTSILQMSAPEIRDADTEVVLKFSNVIDCIGKNVQKQIVEDRSDALFTDFVKTRKSEKKSPIKDEKLMRKLLCAPIKQIKKEVRSSNEGVFELAGVLLQGLMESSQIRDKKDNVKPAFHHEIVNDSSSKVKKIGIIKISKEFLQMLMGKNLGKKKDINYVFLERTLPMIYPPAR